MYDLHCNDVAQSLVSVAWIFLWFLIDFGFSLIFDEFWVVPDCWWILDFDKEPKLDKNPKLDRIQKPERKNGVFVKIETKPSFLKDRI